MTTLTHTYISTVAWGIVGMICFIFAMVCIYSVYVKRLMNTIPLADEIEIEIAIEIVIDIPIAMDVL